MPNDSFTVILLILGFGFVIFFHELGHFLAAKWVGIKVEQFAVGFGQAIIAWRKGIGARVGTTTPEYQKRILQYVAARGSEPRDAEPADFADTDPALVADAEKALGLGETEYRLNWIPLGGYVKMLGQDDLRPNAQSYDPRAYNQKSIPARMLVVSAGVIMNIILAAIGFMIVFRIGFKVPASVVGAVYPDSPAQRAGIHVGDTVVSLDGKPQYDFTKIGLNSALLGENIPVPIVVQRDGKLLNLQITPTRMKGSSKDFLALGIEQYRDLRGLSNASLSDDAKNPKLALAEDSAVEPGDQILAINGAPVQASDSTHPGEYWKLDQAVQQSFGAPITLTIRTKEGKEEPKAIQGHFAEPFSAGSFHIAGMVPRSRVMLVLSNSPARDKLLPGDIITAITRANNDTTPHPTRDQLTQILKEAGAQGETVSMTVLRKVNKVEEEVTVPGLKTGLKLEGTSSRGLGIQLGLDEEHAVVADVLKDSPASRAGLPAGATITTLAGQPVHTWYDVHRILLEDAKPNEPVALAYTLPSAPAGQLNLTIDADQIGWIHAINYVVPLALQEPENAIRKTTSLLTAAQWGLTETRDFVLQFYVTLRRMIDGTVSASNMMGPVGIFIAGKKLAFKGTDWLIWFLSMISANLAVVNFLPIPIVDGGLFTFLVLEKIQGKPLSPRVHAIAQYVGLAFLVGVFLFVTYHDLTRWF